MNEHQSSAVHLWLVMMKAYRALESHATRSIESTGLCFSDFAALEILLHKGGMPIHALGDKIKLTSGALTAAVDRLERKGYAERHLDPSDRRIRIIQLTPAGKALIENLFSVHSCDMESAMADFSQSDRTELTRLLKTVGKGAENRLAQNQP